MQELEYCYAYVDDILVASALEQEHREHLHSLFTCLQEFGVLINLAKCTFGAKQVRFFGILGLRIRNRTATGKNNGDTKISETHHKKQLRQFLGTINFYRRVILGAAQEQAKLNSLLKGGKKRNDTPIEWTAEAEAAFTRSK